MSETTPTLRGNRSQCMACGALFAQTRGFDKHRTGKYAGTVPGSGTRRCLSAEEMTAAGFIRDSGGFLKLAPTAQQLASLDRLRARKASATVATPEVLSA